MRELNLPPSRRSTVLCVVCQSSEAEFHCWMSAGLFQAFQTWLSFALTVLSTVIFVGFVMGVSFRWFERLHPCDERGWEKSTGVCGTVPGRAPSGVMAG